jgi:hypothetical protein
VDSRSAQFDPLNATFSIPFQVKDNTLFYKIFSHLALVNAIKTNRLIALIKPKCCVFFTVSFAPLEDNSDFIIPFYFVNFIPFENVIVSFITVFI